MADNKAKRWCPALIHATVYSLPFLLIGSWQSVLVIWATHAVIDRYRVARFVVYTKNQIFSPDGVGWILDITRCPPMSEVGDYVCLKTDEPPNFEYDLDPWDECSATGYHKSLPDWLAVWLLIIADNTLHLSINFLSLRFL